MVRIGDAATQRQGGSEPSAQMTVVLELGGTTTVVLDGGGGLLLLMQPDRNGTNSARLR